MNKLYLYILAFIVFMGMGASWVIEKANASHEIPIIKKVPNFNFTNQNGEFFSHNQQFPYTFNIFHQLQRKPCTCHTFGQPNPA